MPNNHDGRTVDAVAFAKQLDRSEEVEVKGQLRVRTKSGSVYSIDVPNKLISRNGGPWRPGVVYGSTFGGSMLLSGRLLPGSHMEFGFLTDAPEMEDGRQSSAGIYHTSLIDLIEVIKEGSL